MIVMSDYYSWKENNFMNRKFQEWLFRIALVGFTLMIILQFISYHNWPALIKGIIAIVGFVLIKRIVTQFFL